MLSMHLISSELRLHVRGTGATIAQESSRPMILHDQNITFPKGTTRPTRPRVDSNRMKAFAIDLEIEILHVVIMEDKSVRQFHGSLKDISSFSSRGGFLFFGMDAQETQNRLLADPTNCLLQNSSAKRF
jgi:hypothetical protein